VGSIGAGAADAMSSTDQTPPVKPPAKDYLAELVRAARARRLDRLAIGYAVAGWVLVQAASIILPSFSAPSWMLRAFIILALLGFPIALAAAWFVAPHIFDTDARTRNLRRTWTAFAVVGVVAAVFAAALAYTLARIPASPSTQSATAFLGPKKNSIAVLPFVNMSGDPAKDYFSDGITEELLNDLANTPDLIVAARTSSFAFKGKPENIKDIARILSVRTVLEGSVRESGQHLRITGQLIDADSGYHLWSGAFDSDLTDVLLVQEKIATAITAALTHRLLPQPKQSRKNATQPIDPDAYKAYLLGIDLMRPRTQPATDAALISFEKATRLAPDFADGFAALARAQVLAADFHPERTDLVPAAQQTLARALQLDPRNISALSSHLELSLHKLDWQAVIADARRMREVSPNSWAVLHELFRFYWFMGFPDVAYGAANGAAKLDPLSFVDRLNMMAFLLHNARFPEAVAAAQAGLSLQHDHSLILSMLCGAAAFNGDLKLAHATEAKLSASGSAFDTQYCRFDIAAAERRIPDATAIVDQFARDALHNGSSALDIGEQYAIIGNTAKAFTWLDLSYKRKEYELFLLPGEKIVPNAFFETPQWKAFYGRPLFDDWRKAHDTVSAELAARG
jgi:TolB-like protein